MAHDSTAPIWSGGAYTAIRFLSSFSLLFSRFDVLVESSIVSCNTLAVTVTFIVKLPILKDSLTKIEYDSILTIVDRLTK